MDDQAAIQLVLELARKSLANAAEAPEEHAKQIEALAAVEAIAARPLPAPSPPAPRRRPKPKLPKVKSKRRGRR